MSRDKAAGNFATNSIDSSAGVRSFGFFSPIRSSFKDGRKDLLKLTLNSIAKESTQDNSYGGMSKHASTLQMRTRIGSVRGSTLISP